MTQLLCLKAPKACKQFIDEKHEQQQQQQQRQLTELAGFIVTGKQGEVEAFIKAHPESVNQMFVKVLGLYALPSEEIQAHSRSIRRPLDLCLEFNQLEIALVRQLIVVSRCADESETCLEHPSVTIIFPHGHKM